MLSFLAKKCTQNRSGTLAPALRASCCAVSLLLLGGCATPQPVEPAWPEEAAPAYPTPPQSEGPIDLETTEAKPTATQAPSSALAKQYDGKKAQKTLNGKATYYADSLAGNHTASGEPYDPELFTAAHKKLPFGTVVRVVRKDNGRVTYVKINDRGPFGPRDRIIDLSKAAARELDMLKAGVVAVRLEIVEQPK